MRHFQPVRYDKAFDIGHGVTFSFGDAGHLLGSAMTHIRLRASGTEHTLTFTGDLGRRGLPILRDPAPVPPAGLLICESTYGGQTHLPSEELAPRFGEIVRRTVQRGGTLLIPAFSLGRTQTVVYYLHQLIQAGQLVDLPIFVDSPLSADATEVFRLHPECFDEETARLLEDDPDLFGGRRIHYVRSVEESKRLNSLRDPCVIIAASGMCESGRILHHLKHRIEDERNTLLLVGFQAPHTLGRRLADHAPEVRIHDRIWKVRAEIVMMNGFSSHADQEDFHAYLAPLAGQVAKVRLVHGEPDRAETLATALRAWGFNDVAVPAPGDQVPLP
jgi:metallo-beta-lactamase family protein